MINRLRQLAMILITRRLSRNLRHVLEDEKGARFINLSHRLSLRLLVLSILVSLLNNHLISTLSSVTRRTRNATQDHLQHIPESDLRISTTLSRLKTRRIGSLLKSGVNQNVSHGRLIALQGLSNNTKILGIVTLKSLSNNLLRNIVSLLRVSLKRGIRTKVFDRNSSFQCKRP